MILSPENKKLSHCFTVSSYFAISEMMGLKFMDLSFRMLSFLNKTFFTSSFPWEVFYYNIEQRLLRYTVGPIGYPVENVINVHVSPKLLMYPSLDPFNLLTISLLCRSGNRFAL